MEKTEFGDRVYRYDENSKKEFQAPTSKSKIEEISAHIEKYIGTIDMVFHELVSDKVHIDVHWIKPTEQYPFHKLFTTGMSDKSMNAPEGLDDFKYAELCMFLPESWKLSEDDFEDENNYWPIRWLKYLARFPHDYNTWLSYGHTIPNGDPAVEFASNTKLNTMLLLPPVIFDPNFVQLKLDDRIINFYNLIPLYSEEVEVKLSKGLDNLIEYFDKFNVSDILDINRINTITEK